MAKLGKKARKFAKKHLQSVLRNRRKTKASFKKKTYKRGQNGVEEQVDNPTGLSNGRSTEYEGIENTSLDAVFFENGKDVVADASDSDGYLSEDHSCQYVAESEAGKTIEIEDEITTTTYSAQNKKIHADLAIRRKKLDTLRKKDPEFSQFLESYNKSAESNQNEDAYSDDSNSSDEGEQVEDELAKEKTKHLTNNVITTWCKMVKKDHSQPAFISMLNAYRAACHYGAESVDHRIESSDAFCNMLLFTLSNADDIFRGLLQIPSSSNTKETSLLLKKTLKWKSLKPLVKSYVRSTVFLLNQLTDTDILAFAMTRIRASLAFFAAFPSQMQQLIKASVHLWATGGRVLSSASFLITKDVAAMFGSNYYGTCISKTFVAFISRSRVTEIVDVKHMEFLRDCVVELCSLDVQKSSLKAVSCISQQTKILSWAMRTKKKEALKKMCSWEYVNCIDLWVRFISTNIHDNDLHALFLTTIQLVNGLAHLFPAPRYFPLRLKCTQWLNILSRSNGTFIPLASLVLDMLEYKFVKEGKKARNPLNIASVLKLPKHYLKSRNFRGECFCLALEQLSLHFAQWGYHISFPDLATIPIIRLRKIHEITTIEGLRRPVKRLIDQVEQNVDYVQKKRDDVSFSPHEHQSVDFFLQLEKSSSNAPFTQYYKSVLEKAAERNLHKNGAKSLPEQRNLKRKRLDLKEDGRTAANGIIDAQNHPVGNGVSDAKEKKNSS